jgi:phosphoribosylaminoimidazole synthetase
MERRAAIMPTTQQPRALVLRAPGINCDRETAQACRLVGFHTELVHINQLLKNPDSLLTYHFLVIPGGFSYGDDLGAGTLLAKNLEIHLGHQLHQFIQEGRPLLGICNGFQVLVRLGLLPNPTTTPTNLTANATSPTIKGPNPTTTPTDLTNPTANSPKHATLTDNQSAQFECRWVTLTPQPSPCIFTQNIQRPIELPVAHGEGQLVLNNLTLPPETTPLIYTPTVGTGLAPVRPPRTTTTGTGPTPYPDNPNGSIGNIAGICNTRGNVLGLMPHPERYLTALQHPLRKNINGGLSTLHNSQGDGLLLFKNAYEYASQQLAGKKPISPPQNTHQPPTPQPVGTEPAPVQPPPSVGTGLDPVRNTYTSSGVNIAAGEQAINLMKEAVRSTQGPDVLAGIGAFAGAISAKSLSKMRRPAIVASTDGVGTKSLLASQANRYDTIGYDIVNHSINDLLMQGAKPLFFMDYIAMGKLDPVTVATIVKGIANACRDAGCTLLGGETAEMPDVYLPGAFDLAGTIIGIVEEDEIINGSTISPGDTILGLPSNGLHTNGYSLARRVFGPYPLNTVFPELRKPLIDVLLRPHRSYLREILQLKDYLADRGRYIKGMAHITGGGFAGNIPRILPPGTQATINRHAWSVPPLFQLIAQLGNISREELYHTFNMGIGVTIILSPKAAIDARCILPSLITIGTIQEGNGVVLQ